MSEDMKSIIDTIKKFYGDTSRSRKETREDLEELREELDMLIETLED
jgi:soluble cytochrome b562